MATMRTQRANLAAAAAIASPSTATVLQAAEAIRATDRVDAAHQPPVPNSDGHIPEHEENLAGENL